MFIQEKNETKRFIMAWLCLLSWHGTVTRVITQRWRLKSFREWRYKLKIQDGVPGLLKACIPDHLSLISCKPTLSLTIQLFGWKFFNVNKTYLSISIYLCIYLSIYLSSIYLPIHPSIHPSIQPSRIWTTDKMQVRVVVKATCLRFSTLKHVSIMKSNSYCIFPSR